MNRTLTLDDITNLLYHDRETGKLYWRKREERFFRSKKKMNTWNSRFSGKEAFITVNEGYFTGKIFGVPYKAHRIIWFIIHGKWPECQIDHIDGNRQNNIESNLREVVNCINTRNKKIHSNNSSGFSGVSFHKVKKRWLAYIGYNNRRINVGSFANIEDAVSARQEYISKLDGFTDRHGRAACASGFGIIE
jgi:hypothetical protein